jgi:PAS domain-containing protein
MKGDEGHDRLRRPREHFRGQFNIYYHAHIDVERFTELDYGANIDGFGQCLSSEILNKKKFNVSSLDSRVLWMYVLVEEKKGSKFVVWPDNEIPRAFKPWKRPWYRLNVLRANRKHITTEDGELYETLPFFDAFTGEQIISLAFPEKLSNGVFITSVVDIQAGATPTIYSRMLCLNLLMSFAILVLSFLVQSSFRSYYSKCWYRAWLGVACLYSVSAYSYFGEWSSGSFFSVDGIAGALLPFLSILNDIFFLLTALVLWKPSEVRAQRRLALKTGVVVISAFILAWWIEERSGIGAVPLGECVEAIFTAGVLIFFGAALSAVLRSCASSLDPVRWSWRSKLPGFVELRWAFIGGIMINCFFVICALLQLSIPLWRLRPWMEDLFLFASVPMKVGFAAVFYSVVLVELYWEKFRANQVFFSSNGQGIITVDEGFRVMTANEVAVGLINLPVDVMRGKHLKQILFRSLFEAEEIIRSVACGETVEQGRIRGKRFLDGTGEIEDADYWVTASLVGRGVAGRTKALFVISDAAPPLVASE